MNYRSTRGSISNSLNSAEAVIQGLAPDGGLYVPVAFPKPTIDLAAIAKLTYKETAKLVLSLFFDDYTDAQLDESIQAAYGQQFDDAEIVPVTKNHEGSHYMELFHGPTLAFKDIALQMLPQLMVRAVKLTDVNRKIVILTATSGDTGTASMNGFRDVDGTQVIVFYPNGGVSPVQLQQMLTQQGKNLDVVAIDGNFDQAQTEVKHIFNDVKFGEELKLSGSQFSSANSMNIGRLVPQVAYYFYTYGKLVRDGVIKLGEPVNFTVPTGNFGDILAGYYAKKIGLPIGKLICASNQNNVLTDFFKTGTYNKKRDFYLTNSPSMDIIVSSNLERLLFDVADGNSDKVIELMNGLNTQDSYTITDEMKQRLDAGFDAGFASEDAIKSEIKRVYDAAKYTIDPHTAVASYVAHQYQQRTADTTPMVIVATASPYKFPETVYEAITGKEVVEPGYAAVGQLFDVTGDPVPAPMKSLFEIEPRQQIVVKPEGMKEFIKNSVK